MGEGDTRPRPWEEDESSRSRDSKTPRLDLLAAAAEAEASDLLDWDDSPGPTGGDDDDDCDPYFDCDHIPTDSAHKEILSFSLLSDDAGWCADCRREDKSRPTYRSILVCLECGRQSCVDWTDYLPYGHARDHARQEHHWAAALFDDPQTGFCFKCESEQPVYPESEDEMEIQAGGHAFGLHMPPDLATGLLNVGDGDAWRSGRTEFGSAHVQGQGYAIRGMPNRGNTCYMNAIVQCLLCLDKLRARMLGPDPPLGHLGMALKELFVEASAADAVGGMLNPDKLLRSLRLHADKYEAYKMHDSYELLESLRDALHNEETWIEIPYRERGAPTLIDSIFRGELSETRSCIYCQSVSAFHGHFFELSLSLPSKEHPSNSFAISTQASKNLKSQPKKDATQLHSANESQLGKIDDSHLLASELNGLVVEKISDPLEVDSAEAQRTWQIEDPLQTREDSELSRGITKAPLNPVGFVPHSMSDAKVEQTTDPPFQEYMGSPSLVAPLSENGAWMAPGGYADQNGKATGDRDYIPTIEDCLVLFFKEEVVERNCDCSKAPEEPSTSQIRTGKHMVSDTNDETTVDEDHTEHPDRTICLNGQSSELNSLSLEYKPSSSRQQEGSDAKSEIIQTSYTNTAGTNLRMNYGDKEPKCHDGIQEAADSCLPIEKQVNLLSVQHDQNLSPLNQDTRKRVGLSINANHLGENKDEHRRRGGRAIQRPSITKLPPVLTLQLKRYMTDGNMFHKNEAHVSYKEHLDVGQFMDSSSVDKNNSIYRLASVVEHRGGPFMNSGHYVAYVRARRIGSHQQHSSYSSSWFCADDSNIREVTLEEVLKCKPYILFYERMEGKDMFGIRSDNSSD